MSRTIQQLAEEARNHFETRTRDNGESFYCAKDDAPEWLEELVQDAHGSMFPDDYRYRFIVEALDAIADNVATDEARDSLEADIYTGSVLAWLASHLGRTGYVEEAAAEYGIGNAREFRLVETIQNGQLAEIHEVFDSVLSSLESRAEEEEEEEEDDDPNDDLGLANEERERLDFYDR